MGRAMMRAQPHQLLQPGGPGQAVTPNHKQCYPNDDVQNIINRRPEKGLLWW